MALPIGRREDLHTEFKGAEALVNPSSIAREVVGFLNAEGGDVWIGVGERDGVAVRAEPIPKPGEEIPRLQDVLVDRIEPSPSVGRDLRIEAEPFPEDPVKAVLRIQVERGRERPYAFLDQGARRYVRRTGSRLLPMTREELAREFRFPVERKDELASVEGWVADKVARGSDDFAGLRVAIHPVPDLHGEWTKDDLEPLLRSPLPTGNRRHGWTFVDPRSDLMVFHEGKESGFQLGGGGSVQRTRILTSGAVEFAARIERLHWGGPDDRLWPYALLELPTSVIRLARTLWQRARPPPSHGVLGLALLGIRGQTLKPHSPLSMGHMIAAARPYEQADDFVANPVHATWAELEGFPDRCAQRLTRQVYAAFGYEESEMPREFDPQKGLLTFLA